MAACIPTVLETLTLFGKRGEFGCNRIIDRFIEQDLKFESFGNLGLNYTLVAIAIIQLPQPAKLGHRLSLAKKISSPSETSPCQGESFL